MKFIHVSSKDMQASKTSSNIFLVSSIILQLVNSSKFKCAPWSIWQYTIYIWCNKQIVHQELFCPKI